MATAATVTDDVQPLKRSNSFQFLPPHMSDLRVVLLGNIWSERRSVGNLILGQTVFDTEEPVCCLKVSGYFKEKLIHLINTPDLLRISEDKLREHTEQCASLSDPGPHVFLLVLQAEDFTEEDKQRLCSFLQLYSDQSFEHSLVLISTPSEENSGFAEKDIQDQTLQDMMSMCRYRYPKLNILERPELLTCLGQIVKENNGEHVSFEVEHPGLIMKQESVFEHTKPVLNLVLCGRRGVGKTSAAKAILGHTQLRSVSNSSVCVKNEGKVCGHQLSVVELPSLYGKPQEAVMEESFKSVCLCDPQGIHAFILVLPLDSLTDEDKGELKTIQDTFGGQVNVLTMILLTVESDPADSAAVNFLNENRDIQDLCQSCGGRYLIFNIRDEQQISRLLNVVEMMRVAEGYQCYTKDMFTKAQMEKVVGNVTARDAELLNAEKKSQMGDDTNQSRESLRMVLVGRSDSAKNATANAILGRQQFRSSLKSVTRRATGEIDGRPVVVVTTPSLFDTTLSDAEFHKDIKKCLSMLSPGPHVFLLVLQIKKLTQEEKDSVQLIKKMFGKNSGHFLIVIVTGGEELKDQTVESYIKDCDDLVEQLINDCGGRYQVLCIKDDTNRTEVRELLMKIDTLVKKNGGCYNCAMFDDTEESIQIQVERISKQREKERRVWEEELKRQHETELKKLNEKLKEQRGETEQERQLRTKQLKDKDECINKEREERKKEREERERRWKKQEEFLRNEMKVNLAASEKIVQSEREQREKAVKSLELHRKETKREREAWEKERKDLWEKIRQEDKQNLEEEKKRSLKIQEEYYYKRKKWTICFCVGSFCLLLLSFYILYHLFLH